MSSSHRQTLAKSAEQCRRFRCGVIAILHTCRHWSGASPYSFELATRATTAEGITMRIFVAIGISLCMLVSGAQSQTSKEQTIMIMRSGSQLYRQGPVENF